MHEVGVRSKTLRKKKSEFRSQKPEEKVGKERIEDGG
jgi:hypothetical protein